MADARVSFPGFGGVKGPGSTVLWLVSNVVIIDECLTTQSLRVLIIVMVCCIASVRGEEFRLQIASVDAWRREGGRHG